MGPHPLHLSYPHPTSHLLEDVFISLNSKPQSAIALNTVPEKNGLSSQSRKALPNLQDNSCLATLPWTPQTSCSWWCGIDRPVFHAVLQEKNNSSKTIDF